MKARLCWQRMDENGDGVLQYHELRDGLLEEMDLELTEREFDLLTTHFDQDGDGMAATAASRRVATCHCAVCRPAACDRRQLASHAHTNARTTALRPPLSVCTTLCMLSSGRDD
jgi:hypothetical protein